MKICNLLKFVFVTILLAALFTVSAFAEVTGGDCGTGVTWSFDSATGTLTVSGSGAMTSYSDAASVPWNAYSANIKTVNIENGVTEIGSYAFSSSAVETVIMADSVTSIKKNAFGGCLKLSSLTLSQNIVTINNYAFSGCDSLETLVLPATLASTATAAFQNCDKLANITIPEGVTSIGNDYFARAKALKEIVLPSTLTSIGNKRTAFTECDNLEKITILSPTMEIFDVDTAIPKKAVIHGYLGSTAEAYATKYNRTFVALPEPDIYSGDCGNGLTWGLTESGVLTIYYSGEGTGAMDNYTKEDGATPAPWYEYRESITTAKIEDGVTVIGMYAFNGCTALTSVTATDSITKFADYAFRGCSALESVTWSKNLVTISQYAFGGCRKLDNVFIPRTVTSAGSGAFNNCTSLTNVTIENGALYLGNTYFNNCSSIKEIILPSSLVYAGNNKAAFGGCTSLTKITFLGFGTRIPDLETAIPEDALIVCYENSTAHEYAKKYDRDVELLPEKLIDLGSCGENISWELTESGKLTVFGTGNMPDYTEADPAPWYRYKDSILEVVVEDGVTSIGGYAFNGCTSLISATMADSVTAIKIGAFRGCSSMESVYISKNVESMGNFAFNGAKKLNNVVIPGSLTSTGSGVFQSCTSLTNLVIEEGVTHLGNDFFLSNTSLKSVVLPSTLLRAGKDRSAFKGCSALETVVFLSPLTVIPDDTISFPETAVLYGFATSTASNYAQKYDREFVAFTEFNGGGITVFELSGAALTANAGEYLPVLTLIRKQVSKEDIAAELLFVDENGALCVKTVGGEVQALSGKDGEAILLTAQTEIAIVYDDKTGTARYHVGGEIPTYGETPAIDLKVVSDEFTALQTEAIQAVSASGVSLTASYGVDGKTAEFAGFQIHKDDNTSIRILAGLDMLYYDSVGIEVSLYVNGALQGTAASEEHTVFEAILADGETVSAASLGFRYLSAVSITAIDRGDFSADADVCLKLRPYTSLGGEKLYGEEKTITVSLDAETEKQTYTKDKDTVNLDKKKILVIGNSAVYYGRAVFAKDATSVTSNSARAFDKGYIYQLCRANGYEVEVTNWTYGGHKLCDMSDNPCTIEKCNGRIHLNDLVDTTYDYVLISPGSGEESALSFLDDLDFFVNYFRASNPAVKFVVLGNLLTQGYSSNGYVQKEILVTFKDLEEQGIIIADWGSMVYDVMLGNVTVPGISHELTVNSFIVKDKYHPNPLSGYITALFTYCAITGESPIGQPYEFCYDPTVHEEFDMEAYLASYYSASWTTNFLEIMNTPSDMAALQEMADTYLTTKPYLEYTLD